MWRSELALLSDIPPSVAFRSSIDIDSHNLFSMDREKEKKKNFLKQFFLYLASKILSQHKRTMKQLNVEVINIFVKLFI